MPRKLRDYRLNSRDSRSKLPIRHAPYWRQVVPRLQLGYRKGKLGGVWWGKKYVGGGKYTKWRIGVADDLMDADGVEVLSFTDADERVRQGPNSTVSNEFKTVSDFMRYYMEHQRAASRSADTTQYAIDKHIIPSLGHRKVADLGKTELKAWHRNLVSSTRSARKTADSPREQKRKRQASANRILTILKAALNYAENDDKYCGQTPWKSVKPFKYVDATEHPYLTKDEAIRLQNACDGDFRVLVRAALETGCRYGELASMKVTDFNSDAGTVAVRESKSGKVRHVHLTDSGGGFFDQQTIGKRRSDLLFTKFDGEPWGKNHQQRRMLDACKRADIDPPVPFKALRTTYGSLLAMEGVPLQVIATAMGHADTRITEKHYAHLMPNFVADTIRANLPTFDLKESNVKRLTQS